MVSRGNQSHSTTPENVHLGSAALVPNLASYWSIRLQEIIRVESSHDAEVSLHGTRFELRGGEKASE
jgi:hypothetical protein